MRTTITLASLLLLAACGVETTSGPTPIDEEAKAYPLETCIVTDKALGSMGDPVEVVHEGQTIQFCCEPCIAKFEAEPAKYLAKLDAK